MRILITIEAELDTEAMDKYESYREKRVPTGIDAVRAWITGANWQTGAGGDVEKIFSASVKASFLKVTDLKIEEVQS